MANGRPSERVRVPAPLIRTRLPSGRGATEQPNVTSDGEVSLTPRFWAAIVAAGVVAGLFGDLMMALLFAVEHAAFGYHSGSFESGVLHASAGRRVLALACGGVFGGLAWYGLRRYTKGERSDVDDAVWEGGGVLSFRRSLGTAVISEAVVGSGASLGREAAPKLMAGAGASVLAVWFRLTTPQRRLLVACAAGAGLAAVYNVPLGGALFVAEVLWGAVSIPVILPALACTSVATVTAWIYLPVRAVYPGVPAYPMHASLLVWALPAGAVLGLFSSAYIRVIGWVSHHRIRGVPSIVAVPAVMIALGLVGIVYPQLFGNGKDMAASAFAGTGAAGLLFALGVLKPVVTAACLGTGASGGLLTPTMSTGAVLGGFLGLEWAHLWPGTAPGAFAVVGAAAMLGAAMQAPLAGLALVVELTHTGFAVMVPMMLATVVATLVARAIDGYSIYSARLPALASEPSPDQG
ncbi:MAG TPA: chloride channel protein [Acidimicrobiales bacterium]|nr:chloride channel protein [Acidimicrobiales bacterium]